MNRTKCMSYILITVLWTSWANAQLRNQTQTISRDARRTFTLSIEDAIKLTLENNFEIASEKIGPQIGHHNIIGAKGAFDLAMTLAFSGERSKRPTFNQVAGSEINNLNFSIGFNQRLATGANYRLDFFNRRQETNSRFSRDSISGEQIPVFYDSQARFFISQPLLKGWGIGFNKSSITISQNNKAISQNALNQRVIEVVSDVQSAYWNLVFAIENMEVQKLSLDEALRLLDEMRVRVRVGSVPPSDTLQALASVASREGDIIVAEDAVRDAEDRLKAITNIIDRPQVWDAALRPTDEPVFESVEIDLEKSIQEAFEKRADYAQAKIEIENRKINVSRAYNQTLPSLDLTASLQFNGLGVNYSDNLDLLSELDANTWDVGLSIDVPIGNRSASSQYAASRLEKQRAELNIKKMEQDIIVQIRDAVRQIDTDIRRIRATQLASTLEERNLAEEEERLRLGLSTTRDVLETQRIRATARTNHLKAIIDYNKSLINLEKVRGTTLEKNDIKIEEL